MFKNYSIISKFLRPNENHDEDANVEEKQNLFIMHSNDDYEEDANIGEKQNLFGFKSIQNNKKDVNIYLGLFKDGIECIKNILKKPFIENLKLIFNFYVIFFYLT